jgi:hypothetical protein
MFDIFGARGLAWFCAGERVRALGPDNRTPPKRDFPKHMREKTGVKNPYFETAPILF